MVFQGREDPPGHQENLEETWVKIHIESNGKSSDTHHFHLKHCYRAPEVIQVMLDQEENLDQLDQRYVYFIFTRLFLQLQCLDFVHSFLGRSRKTWLQLSWIKRTYGNMHPIFSCLLTVTLD